MQLDDPELGWYVPALQLEHLANPTNSAYIPAAQLKQLVLSLWWYEPGRQALAAHVFVVVTDGTRPPVMTTANF
jgi:hypothetical protein